MKSKTKKEIKIALWIIAFAALVSLYLEHQIIKPLEANAPPVRHTSLPINPFKKNLTDKDKVYISAVKECMKKGLGQFCVNDLMAIAYTESGFNCKVNGDLGASHGCYQIHLGYHPEITQAEARDPQFATNWTLNRLVHYGYPEYRAYAIMKHNGTPNTPKTKAYLKSVSYYLKNLP
jgi:hypothetical protein